MSVAPALATRVRYVVLAWLCAAALLAYVTRNSISVAEEAVRESLGLSKQQMGLAMGAFFWSYAFLQVPTGLFSHALGSRVALPFFAVLGSLATGWFAAASGFLSLWLARFGMGAAQAGLFPAATNTMAHWFPTTQRGTASGVLTCSMSLGGVLGAVVTGHLLQWTTWQVIFFSFTLPTLAWAAGFAWWFRERPEDHPSVNAGELAIIGPGGGKNVLREPTPWLALLGSAALWWICIQQFFRAAGYNFFATWFATYLKETREVSDQLVGYLNALPVLGVMVGSFAGGMVSDWLIARTGSRRVGRQALAAGTHLLCALVILAGYRIPDPWTAVLVISAAAAVSGVGGPCAYAITMDMGGRHTAPVFALMNMTGNFGAGVFPVVVPVLLGAGNDWDRVMVAFAGIYVVAAVCWIPFNANGTIVNEEVRRDPPADEP